LSSLAAGLAAAGTGRWFPDRPVAWDEHDRRDLPAPPEANHLQDLETTLTIRDGVANEIDRVLALEGRRPALDVNAADEVPCSTWFCPRNHLVPMTPDEVAAGPSIAPPRPPFRITKGKEQGAAAGFQVVDAGRHKFMLKLDPAGHLGMTTGAEMVGNRVFHAAGYNVPGAVLVDLGPGDLVVDPRATFNLFRVEKRPLTEAAVRERLASVARLPDGRLRAVLIPWIPGQILASFDMMGVRPGDANDRIPHELRRSLRASWVLFAWLSVLDAGPINTIDSYVEQGGQHLVRHYFFDFSCAFGSATNHVQGLHQDGEYLIEVGRTLGAFASLGLYQRPFQARRSDFELMTARYRALGYFPAEDFDPDSYRTNRKNPAHVRMTERDAYWGAKIVTAFSDQQIAALAATARLGEPDASYLERALRVRRDIIGRRYLRATAAVESPRVSDDGAAVCFDDLAIARGYADARGARYQIRVADGYGTQLAAGEQAAAGARTCVPIGPPGPGAGYRVVEIRTAAAGRAARVHLRWRDGERRFVVVGLERDE
jgi:hypothetical protein